MNDESIKHRDEPLHKQPLNIELPVVKKKHLKAGTNFPFFLVPKGMSESS